MSALTATSASAAASERGRGLKHNPSDADHPVSRTPPLTRGQYDRSGSRKGVGVVIAGSDRTTRRRAVRRQRDPSSFPYGEELRRARQQLDLSLDALGDRTGVRPAELEALEDGD